MIPPSSRCESVFNLFFVLSYIWSFFCVNREKISFSRPDFVDSEIVIWGLTSLMDFYKRVNLLFKKQLVSDCQKKISFVQTTWNSHFKLLQHQKLLLAANQLQDSTEINSKDIGISKLVSQLKLLPSLFEFKDNDTVLMSAIIKKLQESSRNRSLYIS